MSRYIEITILLGLTIILVSIGPYTCEAKKLEPEAPASLSWFPHGYGGDMDLDNSIMRRRKAIHGLRIAPSHTGAIGQPLWGWDTNGFYRGPQEYEPDPVDCQLPIGLIYPANGKALPPKKKVSKAGPRKVGPRNPAMGMARPSGRRPLPPVGAMPQYAPQVRRPVYGPGYGPPGAPPPGMAPLAPPPPQNRMAPVVSGGNYCGPPRSASLQMAQPYPMPRPRMTQPAPMPLPMAQPAVNMAPMR